MARRTRQLAAAAVGLALLASCRGQESSAAGLLAEDPDYLCATALVLAGGLARTNGDAAGEAKVTRVLHYYFGRLSGRRPGDQWRTAGQDSLMKVKPADVAQAIKIADECSSRMAADFRSH